MSPFPSLVLANKNIRKTTNEILSNCIINKGTTRNEVSWKLAAYALISWHPPLSQIGEFEVYIFWEAFRRFHYLRTKYFLLNHPSVDPVKPIIITV